MVYETPEVSGGSTLDFTAPDAGSRVGDGWSFGLKPGLRFAFCGNCNPPHDSHPACVERGGTNGKDAQRQSGLPCHRAGNWAADEAVMSATHTVGTPTHTDTGTVFVRKKATCVQGVRNRVDPLARHHLSAALEQRWHAKQSNRRQARDVQSGKSNNQWQM